MALLLREQYGGEVSVLSMGPPQAEDALKETLSMGVDRVILVSDRMFAAADTLATSYTLAKAIEKLSSEFSPVDLIICGKQAVDGDTAQTGPGIATRLNYDQATYVTEVKELDIKAKKIVVKRRLAKGIEVVQAQLPALITVEKDINEPRYASLPGLIIAERQDIPMWSAEYIGAEKEHIGFKGSPTMVKRIFTPPPREGGPLFDDETAVKQSLDIVFENKHFREAVLGEESA